MREELGGILKSFLDHILGILPIYTRTEYLEECWNGT